MGDYHACHDATNGMMAGLGGVLGGHLGRLSSIGIMMASINAGADMMPPMAGIRQSQKQHKVIKT